MDTSWKQSLIIFGVVATSIWITFYFPMVVDSTSSLANGTGLVGGKYAHNFIRDMTSIDLEFLKSFPRFITKPELDIVDAIRNSIILFSFSAIAVCSIFFMFSFLAVIAPIMVLFQGKPLSAIAAFFIFSISAVLGAIFTALACLAYFFTLQFQNGTEGYHFVMLILGLPFVLAGIGAGAAPPLRVIIIILPD